MKEKIPLYTLAIVVWATVQTAEARQLVSKVHTIGYLTQESGLGAGYEVFRQELRNLGYVEGKNVKIEYRSAETRSDLDKVAASLLQKKVDVIITIGGRATRTIQKATKTIPIVFTDSGDPIESGFAESLARPGGNLTGITWMAFELAGKRLELLKEAAPKVSRVAVLVNPTHPGELREAVKTRSTSRSLGMTFHLHRIVVSDRIGYDLAFDDILGEKANGLLVFPEDRTMEHRQQIAGLAIKPPAKHVWVEGICGGWRSYGLWSEPRGIIKANRCLCRQDLQRSQAGRSPRRAADEARAGDQFEDSETDRPHDSAQRAGAGG